MPNSIGADSHMTDTGVVDIALIYPELLGTYGDGGNALVLARRLERRGIESRVLEIGIDDAVPNSAAIYLLGGGEDAPQFTALDAFARVRRAQRQPSTRGPCCWLCARVTSSSVQRSPDPRARRSRSGPLGCRDDARTGTPGRRSRRKRRTARHGLVGRIREPPRLSRRQDGRASARHANA